MSTFAELGIPFPLFEAPTSEACDYAGVATCRLCGGPERHCFELSVGGHLMSPCPGCGTENGLSGHDRADVPCRTCGEVVPFPPSLKAKKQLLVCHECLRTGKAALVKETEFGLVTPESAVKGVTGGVPGLRTEQFELVTVDIDPDDDDWRAARVPSEHLWELLRTPGFHTWQGDVWLFHCRRPMTYIGGWRSILETLRPEDPTAFYQSLFDPDDEAISWGYEGFEDGSDSLYVHHCRECGRYRATYDFD